MQRRGCVWLGNLAMIIAASGALALSAGPARAQAEPRPAKTTDRKTSRAVDPTIVVTGTRLPEDVLKQRVAAMVRKLGVVNGEKPAARWVDPICPRVYGLRPEHGAMVVNTVIAAARDAGARIGEQSSCRPNIAISFVEDGGQFVRALSDRSARSLSGASGADRDRLLSGASAIGWWYSVQMRGKDGMVGHSSPLPWAGGNAEGGGSPLPTNGDSEVFSSYNSSIISTQSIRALRQAMVVVDVPKSDGIPLDAISAYVAMVSLAEIAFTPDPPPDSIMSLFSKGQDPAGLTEWDTAFLSALYKVPLDRRAYQQRHALRGKIVTQIDTEEE